MPFRLTCSTVAAALLLTACSPSNPQLMNFPPSREGPDEFLVAPANPLQEPPSPGALPTPTPGGTNRADPVPLADAVVALGGSASALNRQGSPASDGALLAHSSRLGSDPAIRQKVAEEDLEFRRKNNGRLLERLFNANVYFNAYEKQSLQQQQEIDRFRRAGVPTPSAPPAILKPE